MFYLTYLHRELRLRLGRTLLTVVSLAVGVSLVVLVSALSTGVDRAESGILDPLAEVGADLVVTRPADVPLTGTGVVGGVEESEIESLMTENRSLFQDDFSALGRPGQAFERELLFPSTQLTFPDTQVAEIAQLAGVDDVAGSLTLAAVRQKGVVPSPTAAATPRPPVSPGEAIKRVLNPPQTDLATEPYTTAGVDTTRPRLGLVTGAQITTGRFLARGADDEAVLSEAYASRRGHDVGERLAIAGKSYSIVGLARPPLATKSADVYLDLAELQRLSGRAGRVNTLLVRTNRATDVPALAKAIRRALPGASVAGPEDLEDSITGSLVSARTLTGGFGIALGALAVAATVLVAVALTLGSVAGRAREFGTLAALGWSRRLIARQVLAESITRGVLGGLVGAAAGALAALAVSSASVSLKASAATQAGPLVANVGLGRVLSEAASEAVVLTAPLRPAMLLGAVAAAVAGGLLAGTAGAMRAARLRPTDALRDSR